MGGPLLTLLARLTSARATKLDNLDAAISTLPVKTDYSSARATKIDNLDATVSSRGSASNQTAMKTLIDSYLDAKVSEAGVQFKAEEFTSSGVWTRPSVDVDRASILMVGAGAAGEAGVTDPNGGDGGEIVFIPDVLISASLTITLGDGGTSTAENGGDTTVAGGTVDLFARGGGSYIFYGAQNNQEAIGPFHHSGGKGGYSDHDDGDDCLGFGLGGAGKSYGGGGGGSHGDGGDAVGTAGNGNPGVRGGGGGACGTGYTPGAGGKGYVVIFWQEN